MVASPGRRRERLALTESLGIATRCRRLLERAGGLAGSPDRPAGDDLPACGVNSAWFVRTV